LEITLILASASPRREKLLQIIGYPFQVQASWLEKEVIKEPLPRGVEMLALEKARQVAELFCCGLVLGADTVVELDGELLEKPANFREARFMMQKLSGREHRVYTGIAMVDASEPNRETTEHEVTRVVFRPLGSKELQDYLSSEDWRGKAGAYGIQGRAGVFVERLDGCYFNVVGLPLHRTYNLLARWGLEISNYWRKGDGLSKAFD